MSIVDRFYKRAIDFNYPPTDVGQPDFSNHPDADHLSRSVQREKAYSKAIADARAMGLSGPKAIEYVQSLYDGYMDEEQGKFDVREQN